jgi:hypothetical protein
MQSDPLRKQRAQPRVRATGCFTTCAARSLRASAQGVQLPVVERLLNFIFGGFGGIVGIYSSTHGQAAFALILVPNI